MKQAIIYEQYRLNFKDADYLALELATVNIKQDLRIDLTCKDARYLLMKNSLIQEGIFLKQNAHKFGFIIRYPQDKTHITGYSYEPWHIRYVGDIKHLFMKITYFRIFT